MKLREDNQVDGLLVVDKARGPSSHDVVNRIRRVLGQRAVGHAGTLDPMATGVLVVLVGNCTKVSQFMALHEKHYEATVQFGAATDTLDAMGEVTHQTGVQPWLRDELDALQRCIDVAGAGAAGAAEVSGMTDEPSATSDGDGRRLMHALACERGRTWQVPPVHSAIKHHGQKLYAMARRGETVQPRQRPVQVLALSVVRATGAGGQLVARMHVSKGYYVRSFARDLGERLGVAAHLASLRRLRSGVWGLEQAVALDADARQVRSAIVATEEVVRRELGFAIVSEQGARRALMGQELSERDFETVAPRRPCGWFDPNGRLIAIGDWSKGRPTVIRAFLHSDQLC